MKTKPGQTPKEAAEEALNRLKNDVKSYNKLNAYHRLDFETEMDHVLILEYLLSKADK